MRYDRWWRGVFEHAREVSRLARIEDTRADIEDELRSFVAAPPPRAALTEWRLLQHTSRGVPVARLQRIMRAGIEAVEPAAVVRELAHAKVDVTEPRVRRVCDASPDDLPDLPPRARDLLSSGVALVGGAVRDALRGYPRRDLDFVIGDCRPLQGHAFVAEEADDQGVSVIRVGDFEAYVRSFDSTRNQVWVKDGALWTIGEDDPRDPPSSAGYPWNITSCRGPANYLWRAARMAQRGLYADRLDLDMAACAATAPGKAPAAWRLYTEAWRS